jgi:hypothetical protein
VGYYGLWAAVCGASEQLPAGYYGQLSKGVVMGSCPCFIYGQLPVGLLMVSCL